MRGGPVKMSPDKSSLLPLQVFDVSEQRVHGSGEGGEL